MKVPYNYLDRQFDAAETEAILDKLRALVRTGEFTIGPPVLEFERRLGAMIGVPHVVGTNTGTDAQGKFRFGPEKQITPGRLTLGASRDGYDNKTVTKDATAGRSVTGMTQSLRLVLCSRGVRVLHAALRRRRFEVRVLAGAPFQIPPCRGQQCTPFVKETMPGSAGRGP